MRIARLIPGIVLLGACVSSEAEPTVPAEEPTEVADAEAPAYAEPAAEVPTEPQPQPESPAEPPTETAPDPPADPPPNAPQEPPPVPPQEPEPEPPVPVPPEETPPAEEPPTETPEAPPDEPVETVPAEETGVEAPVVEEPAPEIPEDEVPAEEPPPADEWRFSVAPYFWVFSVDGTIGTPRGSASASSNLGDAVDFLESSLDLGLMGRFEASRGDWALFADGELLDYSGDGRSPDRGRALDVEYDLELRLFEAGAARTVSRFEGGGGRDGSVDLLGGLRWTETALDVEARDGSGRSAEADAGNSWADVFVGGRTRVPVSESLDLTLRGDVGGFGIGESADLSWNVVASVDVRLAEGFSLLAGWRWYSSERESHGRDSDLTLEGPFLGFVVRF